MKKFRQEIRRFLNTSKMRVWNSVSAKMVGTNKLRVFFKMELDHFNDEDYMTWVPVTAGD